MSETRKRDFCIECRRETEYILKKKNIVKVIKDKEYVFQITVAVCSECGEEMSLPGLIDKNIQEVDKQYRSLEGLVSIEDIEKLMAIYKIGKAPLSLVLGFGEVTITRYLTGQIPCEEYSAIIKKALSSPAYMKNLLVKNRNKISVTAYNKAVSAASQLENLFSISQRMIRTISCIFESLEEVTPLMLQKLLYFIQGVSFIVLERAMFDEDCEAWIHGPVYPEVYNIFRDFRYNPIEDARFVLFEGAAANLSEEEQRVIDLVINSFGLYSGKVLERITHNEEPWKNSRRGYGDDIPSKEPILKEDIKLYYEKVNKQYGIHSEEGLKKYIEDMIYKNF